MVYRRTLSSNKHDDGRADKFCSNALGCERRVNDVGSVGAHTLNAEYIGEPSDPNTSTVSNSGYAIMVCISAITQQGDIVRLTGHLLV